MVVLYTRPSAAGVFPEKPPISRGSRPKAASERSSRWSTQRTSMLLSRVSSGISSPVSQVDTPSRCITA